MPYNSATEWLDDPYSLFTLWMKEAEISEPHNPNAMCLATVGDDLKPSNRMVLLKGHDERGFVFYTNATSKKGSQLTENMNAALCFYWKSLNKQIRIEGTVEYVSDTEADAYYNSRPRNSRIGAWASEQSRPLSHRDEFDAKFEHYEDQFKDQETIPRPPHWKGYRVIPSEIEFWQEELYRLHRRCLYSKHKNEWQRDMLYP